MEGIDNIERNKKKGMSNVFSLNFIINKNRAITSPNIFNTLVSFLFLKF